jgi:uncharacterized protein
MEALDGYLCALLLSPIALASLPGEAWMPAIWGDTDADTVFASGKQRKRLQLLVLRHLNATAKQWQRNIEAWEPLFTLAEDQGKEWVDAEDWCTGFMVGVDLHAAAWAPRFDDAQCASLLAPLVLLGGDDTQHTPEDLERLGNPEERDAISGEVFEGICQLAPRWLAPASATPKA